MCANKKKNMVVAAIKIANISSNGSKESGKKYKRNSEKYELKEIQDESNT